MVTTPNTNGILDFPVELDDFVSYVKEIFVGKFLSYKSSISVDYTNNIIYDVVRRDSFDWVDISAKYHIVVCHYEISSNSKEVLGLSRGEVEALCHHINEINLIPPFERARIDEYDSYMVHDKPVKEGWHLK